MAAGVPFDALEAPRWMVIEDVLGGVADLGFPWLKRRGTSVDLCAQRFVQHAVDLQVDDVPGGLRVECRRVQVSQILLNLPANAHDAVEAADSRWVRIDASEGGEVVSITVSDRGSGVPADIRNRIMEPFFTTKEIGKGTGLGLSVSKGLAEGHGGRLEYNADAPVTRFVLTLRRASQSWPA